MRQRLVGGKLFCSSARIDEPGYVPLLQAPVLRRLLEVLPVSFGYEREGSCEYSGSGERLRPTSVDMTLVVSRAALGEGRAWAANRGLVDAGISRVSLRVDENGNYLFAATLGDSSDEVSARAALDTQYP